MKPGKRILSHSGRLLAACIVFGAASQAHAVCYVNANATGLGDGTSWADASTYLQTVLIDPTCTEIWVAKGVYKPELPAPNPANSFNVQPGTALYGGFVGNETNRTARNPAANLTILSGDIDNNDVHGGDDQIDRSPADIVGTNSYHVVLMDGAGTPITGTTVIDGFTITGGSALNGATLFDNADGGGLYCVGAGKGHMCSPTVNAVNFIGNDAFGCAAMFGDGRDSGESSPTFTKVNFQGNGKLTTNPLTSTGYGGAACFINSDGVSAPQFTDVLFRSNSARIAGAVAIQNDSGLSAPIFTNVTFASNTAELSSAIDESTLSGTDNPVLVNVTFSGNTTLQIGGVVRYEATDGGATSAVLRNTTFSRNISAGNAGAIYNLGNSMTGAVIHTSLSNVIAWDDSYAAGGHEIYNDDGAISNLDFSVVQGGCSPGSTCTNSVAGSPLLSKLENYGGFTPTIRLNPGSSAIDSGDRHTCPSMDQRGFARADGRCDIGAVEVQSPEDVIFADAFEDF